MDSVKLLSYTVLMSLRHLPESYIQILETSQCKNKEVIARFLSTVPDS